MRTHFELVIFDMDGLMFDTERIGYESWVKAADLYGYKIDQDLFNLTIGANLTMTKEIYLNEFGKHCPIDELYQVRLKITNQIIQEKGVPMKKGLLEILDYLNNHKIKTAVATSTSRERATNLLQEANVIDRFDVIVCGDEVKNSKPNPDIFNKAIEAIGCNSNNTIVLEDSELGIEAAYRAGALPIMIPDMIMPSTSTKEKLYKQCNELTQVIDVIRS